jgi:cytochrome c oxidase accessory protein FixG
MGARFRVEYMNSAVKEAPTIEKSDARAVNSAASRQLYKAREPIYPKLVHGQYRALKWFLLVATLGVYYLLPWVRWPRGASEPDQAVLIDFEGSRFYFFFIELLPSELYYVTGLLVLAALGLFLATALFGRVWCGYACPQTVWTDLFIAIERLVEGDRNQRIKLAKAPWSVDKALRKIAKHGLWLLIAALTGGAWVFYFHDAPTTLPQLFRGEAPASAYLFIAILTFTTYMLAGVMREQVCTYMCPWPRIQAALTDAESLQVTYKTDRGEPRGPHKKNEGWEGRGDCVDCNACVAACPMGIDIREGPQLECINCALCIDACDDIMKKVGRPTRLIGYDTDLNAARRSAGEKPRVRLVRPRTVLYAVLISLIGAAMLFGLSHRSTFNVDVLRDRTPPFVRLSDGRVRNAYTVKIFNKMNASRDFTLAIEGFDGAELAVVGGESAGKSVTLTADGDKIRVARVFLTAPVNPGLGSEAELVFSVTPADGAAPSRISSGFMTGARP